MGAIPFFNGIAGAGGILRAAPGLTARFDAAEGITSSGGFASQWNDLSGNARHLLQATGANQPIHLSFSGTKYGWLPGVASNYFSTPDSVAASITGDIDLRVKVALSDWTPAADVMLVGKWDTAGGSRSYLLVVNATTGKLQLYWYESDGITVVTTGISTVATGVSDGATKWVRATLDVDNGASGYDLKFWLSDDGDLWSQLGATVVGGATTSIFDGTLPLTLGGDSDGSAINLSGQIYRAQIYDGIDGTLAVDFDPSRWTSGTTFTASTGETWTINSTGSKPAQIVDRPSLLFDGAAHYMAASFALNQPETIYLVARQVTWTLNDYLIDGGAAGDTAVILQSATTPRLKAYAGAFSTENADMAVGSRAVVCASFNGASGVLRVNNGAEVAGNFGAANAGGITLGARYAGTQFSNIQAYEALIYNVAHDAATRANVIRALMSKHGVA